MTAMTVMQRMSLSSNIVNTFKALVDNLLSGSVSPNPRFLLKSLSVGSEPKHFRPRLLSCSGSKIQAETLSRYFSHTRSASLPHASAQPTSPVSGSTAKEKRSWQAKLRAKFKRTSFYGFLRKFKRKNTKENICLKSFMGFLGGVILTYIYFFFFVFGLRFPLGPSTYVCVIFGIIFCLGLAFSRKIRCYVLLMIPVFFSTEGRRVLMTYTLFLTFTGPVKNTVQNMGILYDSMTCGQEVIKRTLRQIEDTVKAPFRAVKDTIARILKSLKVALNKIKEFLSKIKRIILAILRIIKKAVSWLGSIVNFCNKKIGTPFQRCMKTFDDAIEDCKAKLGIMDFLCHVVHVVKALCYTVKFLDFICLFTEFVSDSVIGAVKKKLKEFGLQVKNMLYVSIEFSHSYDYKLESTNSTRMIAETMVQTWVEKVEKLDKFFSALGWAFSFFFVFIFFRVYYYKYKYMASDRYDNRYITKYIVELDIRRLKMNKETVLPLEPREKKHFCLPTSIRLLREEQQNIIKALLGLSLSTFEIISFLVCDYCLYWVLFTIYQEGHREYAEVQAAEVELYVSGRGSLAEFYRKLGKALKVPDNPNLHLDPVHCLPDPIPTDKDRYIQIAYLTAICWILAVLEAYGLRLRTIVMSHYFPERSKERAVWLYNHILRSRGSFMKFARRQLRRKIQGEPIERVTLKERLFTTVPGLGILFGKHKENGCIMCGTKGTRQNPLKKCMTPNCPGIYCINCYATLGNICTVCQHPIEYGDISDISEERDSSEEDLYSSKTRNLHTGKSSSFIYESENDEKVITFKDMETRPKFRDLERNEVTDFARKSDYGLADEPKIEESKYRTLLAAPESYELMKEKTRSLLLKLKRQRVNNLKAATAKRKRLVKNSSIRLRGQKPSDLDAGEKPKNEKREYDVLKKAKKLTKKLKQRKGVDGDKSALREHSEILESDNLTNRRQYTVMLTGLGDIDYNKLKGIVMSRIKKNVRKESFDEINTDWQPHSGTFPGVRNDLSVRWFVKKSSHGNMDKNMCDKEQEDTDFTVKFSQGYGNKRDRPNIPKENQNLQPDDPTKDVQIRTKFHIKREKMAKVRHKLKRYVRDEIEKQLKYLR